MNKTPTAEDAFERIIRAGWGGFSVWTMRREGPDKIGCLLSGPNTGGTPLEPDHDTNCYEYHATVGSLLQELVKTAEAWVFDEKEARP